MRRNNLFLLIGTIFYCFQTNKPVIAQPNTEDTFTLNDLYEIMLKNHPVVKQANLLTDQAKQELRIARGSGFDPKFLSDYTQKKYEGKDYFSIWQNQLKIPTWFGAEFKAGYDEAYGVYLDPERKVPNNGLSYVGIGLNLGQGFLMDQRRALLRQAQWLQKLNEAEKIKIINKILLEATKDYWDWYFHYNRYQFTQQGYNFALNRYNFVKTRVEIGEEAAIDSIEARILLQNRFVSFNQAKMEFQNATLQLSNHVWGPNDTPMEINEKVVPEKFNYESEKVEESVLESLINYSKQKHPELRKLDAKLGQLEIDRRLAAENLRPIININYNILGAGFNAASSISEGIYSNNYKTGFEVVVPLFMRKEIGKLQLTKAKIKQTRYERLFAAREISNRIYQFYNELKNTEQLLSVQNSLVQNNYILREGEFNKFNNGESSLFLVNTRETNLIDASIKLAELEAKYEKSKAGLYWAAGKNALEP